MHLLNAAFSNAPMRALWEDDAVIAAMLRFEAALAAAQAERGLIPRDAAQAIETGCASAAIDACAMGQGAHRAGTLAIPFVEALKAHVAQQATEAAACVHYGTTSQDVCDTALVLIAQGALAHLEGTLLRLGDALAALAERHARTPLLARTLLQPAAPVSFGWKAAGWLDAVARCAAALRQAGEAARVLQFGGANGTLAAHGPHAAAVTQALAARLGLQVAPISWHGARDRLARLGNELATLCGMLGKLGRDVSLLMQSEVGEAFEPHGEGRGGSSAMPHKRNPVAAMHMLDAAYRAPALALTLTGELAAEHERGLGNWPNALPVLAELFCLTDNSVTAALETVDGLRVAPEAMRANLERLFGMVYSEGVSLLLARKLGAAVAQRIVSQACADAVNRRIDLRQVLRDHPQVRQAVSAEDIDAACSLEAHLDAAQAMAAQVLQAWHVQRKVLSES